MIARAVPGKRYTLANWKLSVHGVDGTTEARILESAEELQGVLEGTFNIRVRRTREMEQALSRLFPRWPSA